MSPDRASAALSDADGIPWLELALLGDAHRTDGRDQSYDVQRARLERHPQGLEVIVSSGSAVWGSKSVRLACCRDRVELSVHVALPPGAAPAPLSEVTLLGGRAVLGSGACGTFRSAAGFAAYFSPSPAEPVQVVRPAGIPSTLGVVGDASPGRLNAVFSPPPLCWVLGRTLPTSASDVPPGPWLGMSLEAPVERLTFTTAAYEPLDGGFLLRLDYDGHTTVSREFSSPVLVLRPAASPAEALERYREALQARGWAPPSARAQDQPAWWSRPIFCGWGAQCARAAGATQDRPAGGRDAATVTRAGDLARQDVYDELLATLARAGVDPGTVVIDDRWQAQYGTATVDDTKWPDLRGWIAMQHRAGRRVLLWWKAWDPEGLPAEECVTDPWGRPVAVDVNSPAYGTRLASTVRLLLGRDGFDADGFKVDFTQRAPSGESLRGVAGPWGIAGVHALLGALHRAAKAAKPDALVVTQTPHPSFADVCDMVRLNDVLERAPDGTHVDVVDQLRFRAGVARAALPGHLVDTDQWPMPSRVQWQAYTAAQGLLGVPALYYVEGIDTSGEPLTRKDLVMVARTWARYEAGRTGGTAA
ncbi:MAG: hypothetical protein ACJ714_08105 [Ornithinibacter sp.]